MTWVLIYLAGAALTAWAVTDFRHPPAKIAAVSLCWFILVPAWLISAMILGGVLAWAMRWSKVTN